MGVYRRKDKVNLYGENRYERELAQVKKYSSAYEKEVLKVFTAAFVNYPLFYNIFEDDFKTKEEFLSCYRKIMKGIFKATIRKDACYIGFGEGKGFGSDAIRRFVIPLVKKHNGKRITVTTNSENNVNFYLDNGFSLIKEERLEFDEKSVANRSFQMDLQ